MDTKDCVKQDRSTDSQLGEIIDRRYRFIRKLGRGGMGSVSLVHDLLHPGRELALKRIRHDRADPKTIAILKNEFLALSQLGHPNLVEVYDFAMDRETQEYYFTSDYVRGAQLLQATQGLKLSDTPDLRMLLCLFVDILRALEFIHSRGIVHSDLKPENLLVTSRSQGDGKDPTEGVDVKVIDFGLAKREKEFGGKKIFGTSCYIAPETILGSQVDRRTDLYSLGVVFYQMAVRKLPFNNKANVMVLKGHLEDDPVPPHEINRDVPPQLSEIILQLMAKKPAERYPNALAVVEDLNARLDLQFPLETPETMRSYFVSPWCIAREAELAELVSFFNKTYIQGDTLVDEGLELSIGKASVLDEAPADLPPPPTGRFFLIRGEPKIGKSRIVRELGNLVEVRGAHFVHLELDEEGEHERNNLTSFFDALSRVFVEEESDLQAYLLKVLSSLPRSLEEVDDKKQTAALEILCDALLPACKTVPIVLAFSKLENAGESFLRFVRVLVEKIAKSEERQTQLMVVATVCEEHIEKVTLRRLLLAPELRSHFREIPLERFSRHHLGRLFEETLATHRIPEKIIDRVYEESDGNPGIVQEILGVLADNGSLTHGADGWRFGDVQWEVIPGKVRQALKERIQALDSDAKKLGLAFAFLGNACDLDVAAQLAGIGPSRILPTLMLLKNERILREDGEGRANFYSFTQRSARELFKAQATDEETTSMHARAGEILEERLESTEEIDPSRIAHHYLRSGNPTAGAKYSLLAANSYKERHLPRKALNVYWEMRRLCGEEHLDDVGDIDFEIAKLEARTGNYPFAAKILDRLLKNCGDGSFRGKIPSGEVLIEAGRVYAQLGDFRRSGKFLQQAYKLVKGAATTPQFLELMTAYGYLFQIRGNYLESYRYCDKAILSAESLDDLPRAILYIVAAENHFHLNELEKAFKICTKGLACLDKYKDAGYVGFTFYCLGQLSYFKGRYDTAAKHFKFAAGAFRRVCLNGWEAASYLQFGQTLLAVGDATPARQALLRAKQIYESVSNRGLLVEALKLLGEAHRLLGRYEEAEGYLRRALTVAGKLGLGRKLRAINLVCARICVDRGNLAQADDFLDALEEKKDELEGSAAVLLRLALQCQIATMRGDFRGALDLAARATMRSRDLKNKVSVAPLLERRVRLYLELGKFGDAQRSADQLLEIGTQYKIPVIVAKAGMLGGLVLLGKGATDGAIEALQRALRMFKEKEAERELTEIYLELGRAKFSVEDFEQASVYFEEGFYLAKKLNLAFHRTLYLIAMGECEAKAPEGDETRAASYFQSAHKLAWKHGFSALLWVACASHGKLLLGRNIREEAARLLGESEKLLEVAIAKIPPPYQESYRKATGANDLVKLINEVKTTA